MVDRAATLEERIAMYNDAKGKKARTSFAGKSERFSVLVNEETLQQFREATKLLKCELQAAATEAFDRWLFLYREEIKEKKKRSD